MPEIRDRDFKLIKRAPIGGTVGKTASAEGRLSGGNKTGGGRGNGKTKYSPPPEDEKENPSLISSSIMILANFCNSFACNLKLANNYKVLSSKLVNLTLKGQRISIE